MLVSAIGCSMSARNSSVVARVRVLAARRKKVTVVAIAATIALLAAGLTAGIASSASAQTTNSDIFGNVSAQTDTGTWTPVGDQDVLIKAWLLNDTHDGATNSVDDQTTTDADGAWHFNDTLELGSYVFEFDYRGTDQNIANTFVTADGTFATLNEAVADEVAGNDSFYQAAYEVPIDFGEVDLNFGNIVTGTVTSDASGAPLSGQPITIYRNEPDASGTYSLQDIGLGTQSASDGTFTIDGLPYGNYTLGAGGAGNYPIQYWDNEYASGPDGGDLIEFDSAGETQSDFDFSLQTGATVSGTVKSSTGAGLPGIVVTAYASQDDAFNAVSAPSTTTASNGKYTLDGLGSGNYTIGFSSPGGAATKYITQYWNGATNPYGSEDVNLDLGDTITGINATLGKSATITGTIHSATALQTGDYSVYACVAYETDETDNSKIYGEGDCDYDGQYSGRVKATVNYSTGAYTVSNLAAGTYAVWVDFTGPENYQSEYFAGSLDGGNVTPVTVATAGTASNKDITLIAGATISGHITALGAGAPDVEVGAFVDDNGTDSSEGHNNLATRSTTTDQNGDYTITGLATGAYAVKTEANNLGAAQWYSATSSQPSQYLADTINLTAPGGAATGIDFNLVPGGTVTGSISGADTEQGIGDVEVVASLWRSSGSTIADQLQTTYTASDGSYEFDNLAPGDYQIQVIPNEWGGAGEGGGAGYLPSYIGGFKTSRLTVESARSYIRNAVLDLGGRYFGRLVDGSGNPIANVPLYSIEPGDSDLYTGLEISQEPTFSDGNGNFSVIGLPAGTHTIAIKPSESEDNSAFQDTQFTGPAVAFNASPNYVGDIPLNSASTFSGIIVGTDGKALKNVQVEITLANPDSSNADQAEFANPRDANRQQWGSSDSSGHFSLSNLPVGTYQVMFDPEFGSAYGKQYLGGGSDPTASTPLVITTAGQTLFKEVRLYTGGAISGVVTNRASGKAITGAHVEAVQTPINGDGDNGGFEAYGDAATNSKGAYVIPGLTAGGYTLSFDSYSSSFGAQTDSLWVTDKTTVKQNASLSALVPVSGTVTASLDNSDVADEYVEAYPVINGVPELDNNFPNQTAGGDSTYTDANGKYTLLLPPGTWVLYFSSEDPYGAKGADVFLGGSPDVAGATQLRVKAAALAGQDVAMPTYAGGIKVGITHDNDDALTGNVTIERLVGGSVVSTTTNQQGDADYALNPAQIVHNLPDGTYRVTVNAYTEDGYYPATVIDNVVVNGGVTNAGVVDLSGLIENGTNADPTVVAGDGPTILNAVDPQVGTTLAAKHGSWEGPNGPYFYDYHWLRDGKLISGATDTTYTLTPGDAGKRISLEVGATTDDITQDGYRPQLTATSDQTDPVALGGAPNADIGPTVSGTLKAGSTLTASSGTWDLPGLTFSYQWVRSASGNAVTVSTKQTYKATTADVYNDTTHAALTLYVTASRPGYTDGFTGDFLDPIIAATALKQTKPSVITLAQDGSYSVTPGTWSPSGGAVSYEWYEYQAGGSTVTALASGSTLPAPDLTSPTDRVTVVVTDVKAGYASTSVEFNARVGEQTTFTGTPALTSGFTPEPGFVASVDSSSTTTAPESAALSYKWERDGIPIKGALSYFYTFTTADVGTDVSVVITATASGHLTSDPVTVDAGTIGAITSFATTVTTISGSPSVGRTLTAHVTGWSPAPTSVTYRWYYGTDTSSPITGATKATYVPKVGDAGKVITVRALGKRTGLATITGVSDPTATIFNAGPASLVAPAIPGTVKVGGKVTVSTGSWDLKPTSYLYQWYLNGNAIPAATGATYTPLVTDLDNDLSVQVTAVKTGLPNGDAPVSNAVTVQLGAAIAASKAPTLTVAGKSVKSLKLGTVVTASAGTWPLAALSLGYQWQVWDPTAGTPAWVDIDGATTKQLALDAGDTELFAVGFKYRVEVSAAHAGYADAAPTYSAALAITQ